MPLEPFRFLHTANLYLDHQLHGVGRVPEHLRDTLEQATLTAWDRIVDLAITRNVDFVLLAGNSFDAADHTLTGQVALVRGLERLAEHDVPVFIVPGVADPDMAWRLGMALPENVTRFGGELSEPVGLSRDGRTFCTIHHVMANTRDVNSNDGNGLDELAVFAPQISTEDAGPFDIALLETITNDAALPPELLDSEVNLHETRRSRSGVLSKPAYDPELVARCPVEYWALGDGFRRQAWRVGRGMAHTPGSPQGLSAADTGPLGCTLVEVESDGRVRESFLPTARVRWENVSINVTGQALREAVLQQIRSGLDAIPRTSQDELWLITVQISGSGRFYDELQDAGVAERLWSDALQTLGGQFPQLHLRKIRFVTSPDDQAGANFLTQEFSRQLTAWSATSNVAERALAGSHLADGPWMPRMKSLLQDIPLHDAIQEAHRLGWNWLKTGM